MIPTREKLWSFNQVGHKASSAFIKMQYVLLFDLAEPTSKPAPDLSRKGLQLAIAQTTNTCLCSRSMFVLISHF